MSSVYVQEPTTTGKIILHTSKGDINVELWCREAPKACRNFIQLALEGYYDGTSFHRIIPGFIVQGGDPTNTGNGGDSVYGAPFPLEIHSRLKFSRRGLLAMVNNGTNENSSQFFFTLGAAPELNKTATIFGKVVGDTVFNLLKMSELEIVNEKPVYPPVVNSIEVLLNYFDDIVPREKILEKPESQTVKRKQAKNKKLLSFDDQTEDSHGIQSSHDVLDNPNLSKQSVKMAELKSRESRIAETVSAAQKEKEEKLEKLKLEIKDMKRSLKHSGMEKEKDEKPKKKSKSYVQQQRELYAQKQNTILGRRKIKDDPKSFDVMKNFELKLRKIEPDFHQESADPEAVIPCKLHSVPNCKSCRDTFGTQTIQTDTDWMSHKLVFEKEVGHIDKKCDPNELTFIDPRQK